MFSSAVRTGTRLKAWKTNPILSRRRRVSVRVVELADLVPAMPAVPVGGLVEPGEHVHQRRLAGPRGAHDRGERGGRDLERDAPQRVDGGIALAVALGQVATRDNGGSHEQGVPDTPAAPSMASRTSWPSGAPAGASLVGRGEIAQLVEHTTENRGVPGSSPGLAT